MRHFRVAGQGLRLVIVRGKDHTRAHGPGHCGNLCHRVAMAADEPGVGCHSAQGGVDFRQRVAYELQAPVTTRQGVEDAGVEHKHQHDLLRGLNGRVQRSMVMQAQVAAQPDQRGAGLRGGCEVCCGHAGG